MTTKYQLLLPAIALLAKSHGADIRVAIGHSPQGADSITVAVDGPGIAKPFLFFVRPDVTGSVILNATVPDMKTTRARAIALRHRDTNIFPLILATAAMELQDAGHETMILDFALTPFTMKIGRSSDLHDGTVMVPVICTGGKFLGAGDIVNLWVSTTRTTQIAAGNLFVAPLASSSEGSVFTAYFKIPASLSAAQFQVGFHALDFGHGSEIPLLTMPLNVSQASAVDAASSAPPSPVTGQTSVPLPSNNPEHSLPSGTYRVVIGKDGRLTTVKEK